MTPRVAGTEIAAARDDDRGRTLLMSDLHVRRAGGAVLEAFRRVVAGAVEDGVRDTRLLILGDLFDLFVGPRQMDFDAWREVVDALRAASDRGLSTTVLHGNRDFMLDAAFERRTGARVVGGGLRFDLKGRRCLALHGDELCQRDRPYQRAKSILRHRLTRAVLRRLPVGVAMVLGRWVRVTSTRSLAAGGSAASDRYEPVLAAVDEAFALGVDLLVFGHIHRPARGSLRGDPRREYCVLPAFDETGVHLEAVGGKLRFRDPGGRVVADFPPREFH